MLILELALKGRMLYFLSMVPAIYFQHSTSFLFLKVMLLKVKLSIYSTGDIDKQVSFLFIWEYILILNLLV